VLIRAIFATPGSTGLRLHWESIEHSRHGGKHALEVLSTRDHRISGNTVQRERFFWRACNTRKQKTLSSIRLVLTQNPANNGTLWIQMSLHMTIQSGP
jgi:hypothetical protein